MANLDLHTSLVDDDNFTAGVANIAIAGVAGTTAARKERLRTAEVVVGIKADLMEEACSRATQLEVEIHKLLMGHLDLPFQCLT